MEQNKIIHFIMLTLMKGIGPVGQHLLLSRFKSIEDLFAADARELRSLCSGYVPKRYIEIFINSKDDPELKHRSEEQLEICIGKGVKILTTENNAYPDRCRYIPEIAKVLYLKGSCKINDFHSSTGIVGARRCTQEGKQTAIQIAETSVKNNSAIISGMAKGIDSYAHTAAIKSKGYTIAVLGSGPDICYPDEHIKLYESIIKEGCVLSQYPPGTKPRQYNFPNRNHLIAALSDELFVIDAGRNSGTETTVKAAKKYGKPFTVCHNVTIQRAASE